MNDLQRAREKRRAHREAKAAAGRRPVLNEEVVKEADADCKACHGDGVCSDGVICDCAELNFQRRRGTQTQLHRGVAYWLEGCPRG